MLIDSDNSNASSVSDSKKLPTIPPCIEIIYIEAAIVSQIKTEDLDILNKLCIL